VTTLNQDRKVFGLGLSRTGTTSLGKALNILGIRTVHFPADHATRIELTAGQYTLSILEQYQGVVDIPLVPYYAQLDSIYPGSKFILTVREIESWLTSVEGHWRRWRDRDPHKAFTDFVCACVYGTLAYNRDRFHYVYEIHHKNVCDYFSGRSTDLLIMDLFQGEGWDELCHFLGLPIPQIPFPHLNQGHENEEWMRKLDLAAQEISTLLPVQSAFILVDDGKLGCSVVPERVAIPLIEREGVYYGPPPDSGTAIHEMEALRGHGVGFIVFAWPSFWWLEHYSGFQQHLSSKYFCVLETDTVVVFDLRRELPAKGCSRQS
jgi:hypothetical protein